MLDSICHELWSEDGYYKASEISIKEDFKNEDFEYNVKIIFDDVALNENVIDKIYKELTEELETFIKFDENGEEYIKKVERLSPTIILLVLSNTICDIGKPKIIPLRNSSLSFI